MGCALALSTPCLRHANRQFPELGSTKVQRAGSAIGPDAPRLGPDRCYEGEDQNPSPDEYDDLVSPILIALRANPDPTSLAGQLRDVLSSDYGLSDVDNIDEFAEQVVAWSITQRDGSHF